MGCCFALTCAMLDARAAESEVTPRIDSVDLFKNGLCVLRASFAVPGPGIYRWNDVPRVVHGTFWVESDSSVTVQTTVRQVEEVDDKENPGGNLQADLAGKPVQVRLKSSTAQPVIVTGKVWAVPQRSPEKAWSTDFATGDPFSSSFAWLRTSSPDRQTAVPATGSFLVIEMDDGSREYVDVGSIASVKASGPFGPSKRMVEKPVMIFDTGKVPAGGGTVRLAYLSRGVTWAPGYRLDLSDPETLVVRQSAVVRNELVPIDGAEVKLISGYPNIRFSHVDSPLWPGTSLAAFFQQLNQRGGAGVGVMSQQAMVMSNSMRLVEVPALPEFNEPEASSEDIHFESIGRRTLGRGDALSLEVASARAPYQRVVEWNVPDVRDEHGRYQRRDGQQAEGEDGQPWDAIRFSNPFKIPMTTASAVIYVKGEFRGESMSQWVNPGQRTSVPITRALSVRAEQQEVEEESGREFVGIGGSEYQRTNAKGTLKLRNFRQSEINLVIRAEFSGELIEAEGKPEATLRTEGLMSVNPRRRLEWSFKLAPGEEKSLTYRYLVLVRR
jgi:hypothetical protein